MTTRLSARKLAEIAGDAIYVVEHEGVVYGTDSYWLAPVEETGVEQLLAWWNLPVVPGRYEYDWAEDGCPECNDGELRVLRRVGDPNADLSKVIPLLRGGVPVHPVRAGGRPVFVFDDRSNRSRYRAVLTGTKDGAPFFVYANPDYLTIAFGDWQRLESIGLRCAGPTTPIYREADDGRKRCVMPVRLS